jgi:ABC-2 type transport system permease protein
LGFGLAYFDSWLNYFQINIRSSYSRQYWINKFVYLLAILGTSLFITNYTETQQQEMLIAWFLTVVFILMSEFLTPVESMPYWAQQITLVNPTGYFVEVIRMLILEGFTFSDI